ncbi:SCO7613 C-terminal domain-containing membrane protein [Salinispora sp. H7-4]|uniref:SCO7613 C-terminal domain-containing membrane protein n=1 Tax=Salinispora sp. H7-4 TaxID=2748321 RepID=UPI0015D0DA9B|nr:permease [Salinispora sp. H7-4]NYT94152.1 permease [Salinispora sp. H7-4]
MVSFQCSSCGRELKPAARCPHCGAQQPQRLEHLAEVERSIAEMKARDAEISGEQRKIAARMQAALFQRDILAHADEENVKQATRPRRVLRRRPDRRPPTAPPGTPPRVPRQGTSSGPAEPPSATAGWLDADNPEHPPEASSREVQNIPLGLGALLLGVAAVVFAAVATSSLDALARLGVLCLATVLMLLAPPVLARRGLTSTAETISAVGLLLVPLAGYALWSVTSVGGASRAVFAGAVFAVTAGVALAYGGWTGLRAPRFATVLALQPILPLLAYGRTSALAGWAAVLALVAVLNFSLAGSALTRARPVRQDLPEAPPTPPATAGGQTGPERPPDPPVAPRQRSGAGRRTDDGAETDQVPGGDGAAVRPVPGLRELIFVLYSVAALAALGYASTALLRVTTVPATVGAGAALLLTATVAGAGMVAARRTPFPDIGTGLLTLAVISASSRLAWVAAPDQALLLITAGIALTGLVVRTVPTVLRRGPQFASAIALTVSGVVVAAGALRAGVTPVRAALPAWTADLDRYPAQLAAVGAPAASQLAASALLLTVAAMVALPPKIRREFAVVGAALTALAVPAAFGLGWAAAPWPMVVAAVGIGVAGLSARSRRAARAHAVAAAGVGLFGAGAGLARPSLTAAVLLTLCVAGVLVAAVPRLRATSVGAELLSGWAAGGAAFALPGTVAAVVAAGPAASGTALREMTVALLAASFLAVCVTLGYAALMQVSHRHLPMPLATGAVLGALAVAAASFMAPATTAADAWVGALLVIAAVLLFFAPSVDARRRSDLRLDGSDLACAAVTAALVATLVRIAAVLAPGAQLAVAAGLLLVVAVAARALPPQWRRGPVLGLALGGGLVGLLAAGMALRGGIGVLLTAGPIWAGDLNTWPAAPIGGSTWQAPVALALLALAAAVLLPPPWQHDISGAAVVLATIGAPAAFALPWWSPVLVGSLVATGYGLASVASVEARAAFSRAVVASVLALHVAGAGLVRPWTTALALGSIALIGVAVAAFARALSPPLGTEVDVEGPPPHPMQIGGAATGAMLFALPGAVAALAAEFGHSSRGVLIAALAASGLSLAAVLAARHRVPQYLPWASAALVGGATVSALAAIPAGLQVGVYAAAAALIGVLAELSRGATEPPAGLAAATRRWRVTLGGALGRSAGPGTRRWRVDPAAGALAAATVPTVLALVSLAPALHVALVEPHRTLSRTWQGPPPELLLPAPAAADPTHVLTALLLTAAAALAAVAFSGGRRSRAVPVILPGAAVTLLITPVALNLAWPASTLAGLTVFTLAMLGLALTPPPALVERARSLRLARILVFGIGLTAGGAGLAGSLATENLTLVTLGGAVGVGTVAALFGATGHARILGWLFAALMAQLFVLTTGLVAGLSARWSAFGVLAVGAALQVFAATLPRLRRPEAGREAATVEWSGFAAALIALALAYDSPRHIAALLAAAGAILGVAAARPGRRDSERRILFWAVVSCEITAWWILMWVADVALPEAYTLPFAVLALLVGVLELRQRAEVSSWVAYGPALVTAFAPTVAIVLVTESSMLRQVLLLLGAAAVLVFGSLRQQQAPVIVGATATAITAIHALFSLGPWLLLIPVGLLLLVLGASNERRRRAQERLQAALRGMR